MMTDEERNQRNLNPHQAARVAMIMYGPEYAEQGGGSMDFWDKLDLQRQTICRLIVDAVKDPKTPPQWKCGDLAMACWPDDEPKLFIIGRPTYAEEWPDEEKTISGYTGRIAGTDTITGCRVQWLHPWNAARFEELRHRYMAKELQRQSDYHLTEASKINGADVKDRGDADE